MSGSFPKSERAERKAESRARILAAARQVFTEAGYDGAAIRDIAHVAGCSTGGVFSCFIGGKEELWKAAMGRPPPLDAISGWLRGIAADNETASGQHARQLLVDLWGVDA
jgi:hypothetical protein